MIDRIFRRRGGIGLLFCLGLLQACLTGSRALADTSYESLADWSSLPRLRGGSAGMASSYNRTGDTLGDYNNYDAPSTDGYSLVRDITGAGQVTRFWMPHYVSNAPTPIRLTIDGTVYLTNSDALYNGTFQADSRFGGPLVQTLLGGRTSYEPIPFNSSMKIEMANGGRAVFYQWEYRKFANGVSTPSFNAGLSAAQITDRNKAVVALNNVGQNPAGADGSATTLSQSSVSVPANGSVTLANVSGSGQIRSLVLNLRNGGATPSDAVLDNLRVRVRYDGSTTNSIDVPVSQFFGVGHGRADFKSLPLGVADDKSYYSHWPMPYRQGVTVELYNASGSAVTVPAASVEYKAGAVASDAGYLHAVYKNQTTTAGQAKVNLLSITGGGSGQLVGNLLSFSNGTGVTLEGNDYTTADGNVLIGTGFEDAFNGGYYYNRSGSNETSDHGDIVDASSGATPFSGLIKFGGLGTTDQYRWRIADAVPFTDSLNVEMENTYGAAGVNWDSTVFYYQVPEPGMLAVPVFVSIAVFVRMKRRRLTVNS